MDLPAEDEFLATADPEVLAALRKSPQLAQRATPHSASYLAQPSPVLFSRAPLTAAPEGSDARKYALIIARLEAELATIIAQESRVAELTKERDALLRSRREVTQKFESVDVLLGDYAKVSSSVVA